MRKYEPIINESEAAAYAAPFPSREYKAGVYKFPKLVGTDEYGIAISKQAAEFWSSDWEGETYMAVGMRDKMLGPPVMSSMQAMIKGCPEPLQIAEAGHFVQEYGDHIATMALATFGMSRVED